jgi:4-hydroxybutyryl-CoA dehydratase/vinylacetyl-CoA-Delta-isomerase
LTDRGEIELQDAAIIPTDYYERFKAYLANVAKQNVTRLPNEIARLAQDIAGGLMVTLPSVADFKSTEVGKWMAKYFKAREGVCTEDRFRILRLIENLTLGAAVVGYLTESMHGAGSPQAQRIMIARQVDLKGKQQLAKHLCGILDLEDEADN